MAGYMDKYTMLYCENPYCRVNTFEHGATGDCPACGRQGEELS